MLRRWLVGGLAIGLMATALWAKPGTVTNKQGEVFKGDVTEDDKYYYISSAGGKLALDKRNIASVTYDATIDDQYNARHAKLSATDVKGRIELAKWANENNRIDLAIAALQEARQIDPTDREAARALDAAQQQADLDKAAAKKGTSPGAATQPAAAAPAPVPTPPANATVKPLVFRLLNPDEINIIRQKEFQKDDSKLRIKFDNGVVKKYLATGDHDAAAFNALPVTEQAIEILTSGDPTLAKDVRIMNDPAPLLTYKLKVQPIFATGCAATACHGGTKSGDFHLYPGDSTAATYTNFFILQTYSKTIDKVKYLALDRGVPDNSLALQFGLPTEVAKPIHPVVPGWKPRFKSADDPAYSLVYNWLYKSLGVVQPDYGIKVAVRLPSTQMTTPTK